MLEIIPTIALAVTTVVFALLYLREARSLRLLQADLASAEAELDVVSAALRWWRSALSLTEDELPDIDVLVQRYRDHRVKSYLHGIMRNPVQ